MARNSNISWLRCIRNEILALIMLHHDMAQLLWRRHRKRAFFFSKHALKKKPIYKDMIEMKKRIKSDGKLDNNDHIMHISFLLCYLMMIRDYESIIWFMISWYISWYSFYYTVDKKLINKAVKSIVLNQIWTKFISNVWFKNV